MRTTAARLLFISLGLGFAGCHGASEAHDSVDDFDLTSTESPDLRVDRMKLLQYLSAYSLQGSSNLNQTGPGWQMNIDSCERVDDGTGGEARFDCTKELEAMVAAEWHTTSPIPLAHQLIYATQHETSTGRYFANLVCNLMEIDVVIDANAFEETWTGVGFYFRDDSLGESATGRLIEPDALYVAEPNASDGPDDTRLRFLAVSSCYVRGTGAELHSTAELKPFVRIGGTEYWETRPLNHTFPTPEAAEGFQIDL